MNDVISVLSHALTQANRYLLLELAGAGLEGLATSHGDVLVQLFQKDGLPMSELAQRVDRDPSTVTALVRKLAAQGYVTTARAEEDRRSVVVSLSPQGRELEAAFARISDRLAETLHAGIDEDELEQTRAVLLRIQENFRAACDEARACR